jgi:hypothetical protein
MVKEQVCIIAGIHGLAEWRGNDDCLNLDLWYMTPDGLKSFKALCPHGLCKIHREGNWIPPEHVEAATVWVENMIANKMNSVDRQRGYADDAPTCFLTWWRKDKVWEQAVMSLYFDAAIRSLGHKGSPVALPDSLAKSVGKHLNKLCRDFMATPEVQNYLQAKAGEMANWWASKIGGISPNVDPMVNFFNGQVPKPIYVNQDVDRFYNAMRQHAIDSFSQGLIPFYDTDYGIGWTLSEVLTQGGVGHLSAHFPFKAWQHFDFSDAPIIVDWASQTGKL